MRIAIENSGNKKDMLSIEPCRGYTLVRDGPMSLSDGSGEKWTEAAAHGPGRPVTERSCEYWAGYPEFTNLRLPFWHLLQLLFDSRHELPRGSTSRDPGRLHSFVA
jgi:hypothetical protein